MIDLQEYVEFPAPGSGRTLPMVSINEKGLLTRNRAFLVETGGVEEFRAYIHKTGWQILLFPQGEPNLWFRKSGARNKELARQLRGQGYSFPVRYRFSVGPGEPGLGGHLPGDGRTSGPVPGKDNRAGERREETVMKKRQLSRAGAGDGGEGRHLGVPGPGGRAGR